MTARIRLRRADYGNWDSDEPTLDHGEIGLIYDEVDGTETIVGWVVGNGEDAWGSLPINRPPQANQVGGTRTGLGDGDGIENDGNAPVSYDDIALLALDNTFAGDNTFNGQIAVIADEPAIEDSLTVYGSLKVRESDTDLDDGNVTLEDGNLTMPLFDDDDDTHHLRGPAGTTGGIAFPLGGPFLGNSGGDPGKVMSDTLADTYGPWLQVKDSGVWVGGHKDASGAAEDRAVLKYHHHPENATLVGLSDDKIVPTRKQIVDYVEEYVAAVEVSVSVLTGAIATGATIPLPSGYTQEECKWIVSVGHYRSDHGDHHGDHHINFTVDENRVVSIWGHAHYLLHNNSLQNMLANYMIIGVH